MANPNPSPATRFGAGNPSRAKQKGARDRLSAAFLKAMADDFDAHGSVAVVKVREEDPATYLRVIASLAPKELELTRPLEAVSDEALQKLIDLAAKLDGESSLSNQAPDSGA